MFQALLAKPLVKGVIDFLRAIPPVVWLVLAAIIGIWLYGSNRYEDGRKFELDKAAAVEAKRRQQVAQLAFDLSVATSTVETVTVTKLVRGAGITKVIKEKINVYVPAGAADLPGGFRLLHDAAARDVDPPPPSEIGNAAAVSAQDVTATVTENYREANDRGYKLESWQEWWKAVEAACKKSKSACVVPDE